MNVIELRLFLLRTRDERAKLSMNISKGDIVEHKTTGQTWQVMSVADGKLRVKGNGQSLTFLLSEVKKAPDRPARVASQIAKR